MERKTIRIGIILFLAVLIEVITHDILLSAIHKKLASWIYLFSGIAIGFIPLINSKKYNFKNFKIPAISYPIILSLIFILGIPTLNQIFIDHPIDYRNADMLPIMEIMSERFLMGSNPYEIIPEIWGGMQPIYLPSMWIPFLPSVILDFDMRWTTYFFIFIGLLSLHIVNNKQYKKSGFEIFALIPICALLYSILKVDIRLLVHSEEGIVIGYYLLLAAALYYRSFILIAIALTSCMMSRYSLAVWAFMFLFYVYNYHTQAKALKLAFYTIGFTLILLIVTRGFMYLDVFMSLSSDYLQDIQNPDNRFKFLPSIENNLGMAKFFKYDDLGLLHQIFFVLLFAIPALCLLAYHRYSNFINKRFFNLCSLKLTLVFFYNFLIVPAQYLFYTSTFFSIAILYFYLRFDENTNPKQIPAVSNM